MVGGSLFHFCSGEHPEGIDEREGEKTKRKSIIGCKFTPHRDVKTAENENGKENETRGEEEEDELEEEGSKRERLARRADGILNFLKWFFYEKTTRKTKVLKVS